MPLDPQVSLRIKSHTLFKILLKEGLTGCEKDTSLTQFNVRLVACSVSLQSPSKGSLFARGRGTQPPLTEENNEQMLSELGKKYWDPPTRATLAGAAWLPRGAAGTGLVMVGSSLVSGFTGAQTFSDLALSSAIKSSASRHPPH